MLPTDSTHVASTMGPTRPTDPNEQETWQIALQMLTAAIMWLMAVFGNCLVILVVRRSRRLQSTTNYFVVSLALADLLVALFCLPVVLIRVISQTWLLGNLLCKVVRFTQYMAPSVTVLVLVGICVDRFYTILYPLSFKITRGKAKKIILVSWFLAIVLSCPTFYFFEVDESSGVAVCNTYILYSPGGIMYSAFVMLVEYLLPLLIVFVIYTRVVRHIWRVGIGAGWALQRTTNAVPRTKVKTVKMLMIVSAVYFALWGPFFVTQLWFAASSYYTASPEVYIATVWLAFGSSASNPIIYSYYNPNFRRGCREVFCMSTMKCYRSNTYAITTSSRFSKRNHVGVAPMANFAGERGRPPSPYRTFDRDMNGDKKLAWPLPILGQSTYL
ncbi:probable G-protein coupled receptor 19 [Acanthaster planci]|uniref:Probable G-protein coupled receptor 19 n=1 Tax=Acanthaster planci TaxID=133434 RepID=A0A8B7XSK4_ACAPL|nr:probable G-protein coupled receptor 19 [Acanthaster planci]